MCMRAILLLYLACYPCSSALRPSSASALMHNHQRFHANVVTCCHVDFKDHEQESARQWFADCQRFWSCYFWRLQAIGLRTPSHPTRSSCTTIQHTCHLRTSPRFGCILRRNVFRPPTYIPSCIMAANNRGNSGAASTSLFYLSNHENHERNVAWEEVLFFALS